MTETSTVTKKDAEKAAAALLQQQLLGPISELFEAKQDVERDHRTAADQEAQEVLDAARRRAQAIRDQAKESERAAQQAYADAYKSAQARGWTADQLDELGYATPRRSRARSARTANGASTSSQGRDDAAMSDESGANGDASSQTNAGAQHEQDAVASGY